MLIVFEGIDGAGKTTLATAVVDWLREEFPERYPLLTHEPYQADSPDLGVDPLFWYCMNRQYHIRDFLRPALEQGRIVVCDRYYHSTAAYQATVGDLWQSHMIAKRSAQSLFPDIVFWVRTPVEIASKRRSDETKYRLLQLDVNYLLLMNFHTDYPTHTVLGNTPLCDQLNFVKEKIKNNL